VHVVDEDATVLLAHADTLGGLSASEAELSAAQRAEAGKAVRGQTPTQAQARPSSPGAAFAGVAGSAMENGAASAAALAAAFPKSNRGLWAAVAVVALAILLGSGWLIFSLLSHSETSEGGGSAGRAAGEAAVTTADGAAAMLEGGASGAAAAMAADSAGEAVAEVAGSDGQEVAGELGHVGEAGQEAVVVAPEVAVAEAMVFVTTDPSGAKVFRGEQELGLTPFVLRVPSDAPAVELRFERSGYVAQNFVVDPSKGETVEVILQRVSGKRVVREGGSKGSTDERGGGSTSGSSGRGDQIKPVDTKPKEVMILAP